MKREFQFLLGISRGTTGSLTDVTSLLTRLQFLRNEEPKHNEE